MGFYWLAKPDQTKPELPVPVTTKLLAAPPLSLEGLRLAESDSVFHKMDLRELSFEISAALLPCQVINLEHVAKKQQTDISKSLRRRFS